MNIKIFPYFLFICLLPLKTLSQETYTVSKAPFSKKNQSEFSPVFYKNGIVFSANRNKNFSGYANLRDEGFFNLYYVDTTGQKARKPRIFSRELKTKLNDGPVTFNSSGDTLYYSRNLVVEGSVNELSSSRNKLGIFMSVKENERWTKIREFRHNNEWYNVTTPCLSPDGQRLYFASDKPGGYGGSDLYYCDWKDEFWDEPVNLGEVINTEGNEAYPFINSSGELFFASDGHQGMGGRDIFVTKFSGDKWLKPVLLDPPINSEFDDFGIITDTLVNEGYFSSNREGPLNIYNFTTNYSQIFYSDIQKENQHCFQFSDEGLIEADTTILQLRWDFGDNNFLTGDKVRHCFSGPGDYTVKLDIIDRKTGKIFFSKLKYDLQLRDYVQAFINSPDFAPKETELEFNALDSNLPGFVILGYDWDFGDGKRTGNNPVIKHSYSEAGKYNVSLIMKIRSEISGALQRTIVTKPIMIFDNKLEAEIYTAERAKNEENIPDINEYENAIINMDFSAETKFQKDAVFGVELTTSPVKIDINDKKFRNIPEKYTVREIFEPEDSMYHYYTGQQMKLMFTYPAFTEIISKGYTDAKIKLYSLTDPVERELYSLKKNYGTMADIHFDTYGRLTPTAYLFLDQIVILMNKNQDIRMEVGVHTDNLGTPANNLKLSQTRAQTVVDYLINRGINTQRVIAKGYGDVYPVAPNVYEADRRFNRRLDFRIVR